MVTNERLTTWRALSELFLDTEIEQLTLDHIARTVQSSPYTTDQVEDILWAEVYPVLKQNLTSVAGIWDGWSDSWLKENLTAYDDPASVRNNSIFNKTTLSKEIQTYWSAVKSRLNS